MKGMMGSRSMAGKRKRRGSSGFVRSMSGMGSGPAVLARKAAKRFKMKR